MKGPQTDFPVMQTAVPGVTRKFDLNSPAERREYFDAKAGPEIAALMEYLKDKTFVAYLLGKKNSGKGTYTKLMAEIFGADKIGHISVGDIVRETHKILEDPGEKEKVLAYLGENYRGYISLEDSIDALLGRNQKTLLPTEFILALVKMEIDKIGRKAIFIDGFPRNLDQVQYSLYFKNLIDYRSDPDIFVAINIPESILAERMQNRVVCPKCQTPRNLTTLPTKEVGYDKATGEFFLKCDNSACGGERMRKKEGDNAGLESIRDRLELDDKLIKQVMSIHGVSKILLQNAVPVDSVKKGIVDDYEITPHYTFEYNEISEEVILREEPWIVKDDEGNDSYSLLSAPVVLALVKQLVKVLGL